MARKKTEKGIRIKKLQKNWSPAGNAMIFIIIVAFGIFVSLPLVYAIGNAFKPLNELWIFPPPILPKNPTLNNFRDLFTLLGVSWVPMSRYFFNTVFITIVGTAGNVILASMCAYPLAKRKFPGSKLIFSMIVTSLMFSAAVTSIPNYLTMVNLGWVNSYKSIIVPAIGSTLGLYLMKQFMEQLPDSLLEAAKIDGGNEFSIFWGIVMPNVKPAWLTLIVYSVSGLWNMGASVFIYSEELKTFPYAISQIVAGGIARAGVGSAVTVVMMIVPILTFIVTQSNVIQTMTTSGMKD